MPRPASSSSNNNNDLNIPSFLKNPRRRSDAKTRDDEVDAVMESIMISVGVPLEPKSGPESGSDLEPSVRPKRQTEAGGARPKARAKSDKPASAPAQKSAPVEKPAPKPESESVEKPAPVEKSVSKHEQKPAEESEPLPTHESEAAEAPAPSSKSTTEPAKESEPAEESEPSPESESELEPEPEPEPGAEPTEESEASPEPASAPKPAEEPAPEPTLEDDLAMLAFVEHRLYAHRYAAAEIETYGECIDPPKATADRAEVLAVLVEEDHELLDKPEVGNMLERLASRSDELEPLVAKQVQVLSRDRHQLVSVPANVRTKLVRLQAESYDAWLAAKANNDWRSFAPYLDRLVSLQRKIAKAINPDAEPYDTLLDMFEQGTNRAFYNNFFARVKQCVVPLLSSISMSGRTLSRACVEGRFDEARQWELAQDVARIEGIDESAHYLTSTEHPFSQSMTSNYVVTAAHVDTNDLMSNVFTMLHEVGHNLYEQGVNPDFNRNSLHGGTSMGMHEAQSRFFENYIGRDRAFVSVLLTLLKSRFPGQIGRVTPNQFYRAINRVAPSLIRVNADELTYPLHILIRYEIEQLLMAGKATAREVPKLWAERYERYIGATVTTDTEGALQDVHWAQGMFGYFPTYALGNAYAAQLRAKMIEEGLDWERTLASGDLAPIRAWLHERVWQYGRSKDAADIIKDACGEPFSPRHYANYLTHKYVELYGLR